MIAPEEQARADCYGLIARLFHAAPDAGLLAQLLQSPEARADEAPADAPIAAAWQAMIVACREASPAALEDEHTGLFLGTGKAEVTPYLSHYVLRHANDNPLVELRAHLAAWGIARREEATEYEDHVASVCETMRYVIAVQQRSLAEQKAFFERFVYRGVVAFCSAVNASKQGRFYRHVAQFAKAFVEVEKGAFEMVG
jgi:TorA maturation chaperone TorD